MNVITKPKILKAVRLMPQKEQVLFAKLVRDLHDWVACRIETIKGIELEVTYVGSRENAPY